MTTLAVAVLCFLLLLQCENSRNESETAANDSPLNVMVQRVHKLEAELSLVKARLDSFLNSSAESATQRSFDSGYWKENTSIRLRCLCTKGEKGDPGPQGVMGISGLAGRKGEKGEKGDQGPTEKLPMSTPVSPAVEKRGILEPPSVSTKWQTKEVIEGHSITLECPVEDNEATFVWLKDGTNIIVSQSLQLSVLRDKLHIVSAQPADTAVYLCVAKNEAGQNRSLFDVKVLQYPKIIQSPAETVIMVLDSNVSLFCKATGLPKPDIYWLYSGDVIFNSSRFEVHPDGVLVIRGIQMFDQARYTCKAENSVGAVEADTFLEVTEPPKVAMPSEELKALAGFGVTIRCAVFGTPTPEVKWLKDGKLVSRTDVLQLLELKDSYKHIITFVYLRNVTDGDAGRYTCVATNKAGATNASVQLTVLVKPTIEDGESNIQVVENTTLSIDCRTSGTPPLKITWLKDGLIFEHNQTTNNRLVIRNVQPSNAGRYTCEASNEAGVETADFAVEIYSRPKFKHTGNQVNVIEGNKARLDCEVEGRPRWRKAGHPVEGMDNLIRSPRGESLIILNATSKDAGIYSCVAQNVAGETEASFAVVVVTSPRGEEAY